jgi:hypothetical protein
MAPTNCRLVYKSCVNRWAQQISKHKQTNATVSQLCHCNFRKKDGCCQAFFGHTRSRSAELDNKNVVINRRIPDQSSISPPEYIRFFSQPLPLITSKQNQPHNVSQWVLWAVPLVSDDVVWKGVADWTRVATIFPSFLLLLLAFLYLIIYFI